MRLASAKWLANALIIFDWTLVIPDCLWALWEGPAEVLHSWQVQSVFWYFPHCILLFLSSLGLNIEWSHHWGSVQLWARRRSCVKEALTSTNCHKSWPVAQSLCALNQKLRKAISGSVSACKKKCEIVQSGRTFGLSSSLRELWNLLPY